MSAVEASELEVEASEESAEHELLQPEAPVESEVPEPLSLCAVVGSLLFVSPRPISLEVLAEAASASPAEIECALEELSIRLRDSEVGFGLAAVSGGYQLRTSQKASKAILNLIPPKSKRLSRAAAETLAVIAYKQPVQRSEIEAIRGVDALPTLKTLLDAKLIR